METRNRRGERRDWLRGDAFECGLRRLANRLPILWHGTVLDGELIAGRFAGTIAALYGSKRDRDRLRFVAFDVPVLAGVDLRSLPWQVGRERLELLARAFDVPLELSPVAAPSRTLVDQMQDGRLEGIVLKDRTSSTISVTYTTRSREFCVADSPEDEGGPTTLAADDAPAFPAFTVNPLEPRVQAGLADVRTFGGRIRLGTCESPREDERERVDVALRQHWVAEVGPAVAH